MADNETIYAAYRTHNWDGKKLGNVIERGMTAFERKELRHWSNNHWKIVEQDVITIIKKPIR